MAENKNNQPLTLNDLGKFTEDVLLPAVENIVNQQLEVKLEEKLEEKLDPIKQEIFSIKQDLKRIEAKLDSVAKAASEDVIAVNNEVEKLKIRMVELEREAAVLKSGSC